MIAGNGRDERGAGAVDLLDRPRGFAGVRARFPILDQEVRGKPLVYLDNAASTQKPREVIDAVARYYERDNANVHRGVHALSDRATAAYEGARETVRRFLNAREAGEIVFVRGTTEAINLVAQTFGRREVGPGDEVLITAMEHHANLVPWQQLCLERGAKLRVAPVDDRGDLDLSAFEALLTDRVRLLALPHVSNALGTVNPIAAIVAMAHRRGIPVLVDGAQGVAHARVDVQAMGCDFYAFSGHKVFAPMGIGVLYGRANRLADMPPWQFGGDMVDVVTFDETTFGEPPHRFEAGTPNVAGAVGMAAALEFLERLDRDGLAEHESALIERAVAGLGAIPGVRLVGSPTERAGVVSFLVDDPPLSALDVSARLDAEGIAVRAGNHCCQPLMGCLGVPGTVRASFAPYNDLEDVDRLVEVVSAIAAGVGPRRSGHPDEIAGAPSYPAPVGPTPDAAAEELLDEIGALDGWEDRYEFLIELGRAAPDLPDSLRTEANRVRGCQSTVYLAARVRPETRDVVEFLADSDSELVRGLLAVLQQLYSGRPAGDLLAFDLDGFLARAGLDSNLTTGRRNGLAAMIRRLREFAGAVSVGTSPP